MSVYAQIRLFNSTNEIYFSYLFNEIHILFSLTKQFSEETETKRAHRCNWNTFIGPTDIWRG